jgi:hypothetical protein
LARSEANERQGLIDLDLNRYSGYFSGLIARFTGTRSGARPTKCPPRLRDSANQAAISSANLVGRSCNHICGLSIPKISSVSCPARTSPNQPQLAYWYYQAQIPVWPTTTTFPFKLFFILFLTIFITNRLSPSTPSGSSYLK